MNVIKITKHNVEKYIGHEKIYYPSDFSKLANNKFVDEIETELKKPCITDKSIYEICEKKIINGFKVLVFKKDMFIFKGMCGYITNEIDDKFLYKNEVMWFSNKYISYDMFCTRCFLGMCVYKVKKEHYMLDYYDKNTIKLLMTKVEKIFGNNSSEYITLKKQLGYKTDPNSVINEIKYKRKNV